MRIKLLGAVLGLALANTACAPESGQTVPPLPTGTAEEIGPAPPQPEPDPQPTTAPVAIARRPVTGPIRPEGYQFDGSRSTDPDEDDLTYEWTMLDHPEGATIAMDDPQSAVPTIYSNAPGEHIIKLTVTDTTGLSDSDTVRMTLTNEAPVAVFEPVVTSVIVGQDVTLDGSSSSDPNGTMVIPTWRVLEKPAASKVKSQFTGALATVDFDAAGAYRLALSVSDGFATTEVLLPEITVEPAIFLKLDEPVRQVNMSVDTGILMTANGDEASLVDPERGRQVKFKNRAEAITVGVSPDGKNGAVSLQDLSVAYFNLEQETRIHYVPVSENVNQIMMDNAGVSHIHGAGFRTVDLSSRTGNTTDRGPGGLRLNFWYASLHPSRNYLYAGTIGRSPRDFIRFNIVDGRIDGTGWDSRYHGDYTFSPPIWAAMDGLSLLTASGEILTSGEVEETDMIYRGQIPFTGTDLILKAAQSAVDQTWFTILNSAKDEISLFNSDTSASLGTFDFSPYPDIVNGDWTPIEVFTDSRGLITIILKDNGGSDEFALLRTGLISRSSLALPPVSRVQRYQSAAAGTAVTLDASQSFDRDGGPLSHRWTLVSQPALSALVLSGAESAELSFTPAASGVYEFQHQVSNGSLDSPVSRVTVYISGADETVQHRLQNEVAAARYSRALDALVYMPPDKARLYKLDIESGIITTTSLPQIGNGLSIAPQGDRAVVSHDSSVSLIDVTAMKVDQEIDSPAPLDDIVFDANGRAHALTKDRSFCDLYSFNFATGEAQRATSRFGSYRCGSKMSAHPNGEWVYMPSATNVTPKSLWKFDVTGFPIEPIIRNSGTELGGITWIREDGRQMLSRVFDLFLSSNNPDLDMDFFNSLDIPNRQIRVNWADNHHAKRLWAVNAFGFFEDTGDNFGGNIFLYSQNTRKVKRRLLARDVSWYSGREAASHEFVFFSGDGSNVVTVFNPIRDAEETVVEVHPIDNVNG